MVLQIVGACLIVLAIVLMWVSKLKSGGKTPYLYAAVCVLVAVGVIDLVLIDSQQPTISEFIRQWLPGLWGVLAMIVVVAQTWSIFGLRGLVPVLIGCILGHLFW
jgi:hypothetical protein